MSVGVLGSLMAGWSSANKFSLLGGLRVAAQLMAYELPFVLAAVSRGDGRGHASRSPAIVDGLERRGGCCGSCPALVVFFVAGLAELQRPPFDMPVADAEIIFGPYTEYTGIRFALFLLAEYAGIVVLAALTTVLFLGGWHGPWPDQLGWLWTLLKIGARRVRRDLGAGRLPADARGPAAAAGLDWSGPARAAPARAHDRRGGADDELIFGRGLLTGLRVTWRQLTRRSVTAHYPDALPELPPRSRGVIALMEENCTVCMLCARECPAWCIYIDSHKETVPPATAGRPRAQPQHARPLRHRLLAVHVLRHLHRGLPVRRAVLVAGVRVRRVRHPRPDPREGPAPASGCGPCRRRPPSTRRAEPPRRSATAEKAAAAAAATRRPSQDVTRDRPVEVAVRACSGVIAVGVRAAGRRQHATSCTARSGWS